MLWEKFYVVYKCACTHCILMACELMLVCYAGVDLELSEKGGGLKSVVYL